NRLIASAKGKTLVIPLSGGYDSRLILALLVKHGYKNIICFTYGVKTSYEINIAKKVSEKLNVKIEVIEYNNKFIDEQLNKEEFYSYVKYGANFISLSHIQDLLAVKYLKLNNLIHEDAIFVPGHSGDIFAGTHISANLNEKSLKEIVVSEIKKKHFTLQPNCSNNVNYYHQDCFGFSNMEAWSWKERQSKFIVNSIRVYEYYGYTARLPLWDKELATFFKSVPYDYKNRNRFIEYRIEKNLYDAVAFLIFKEQGVAIQKLEKFTFVRKAFSKLKRLALGQHDPINNFDYLINKLKYYANDSDLKSSNTNGDLANLYIKILRA
ncbi:MAG: asparagine synthase, partial [Campylobacterales bacterium]|nr:asparagine synthase [Campylobacterales bacterium]